MRESVARRFLREQCPSFSRCEALLHERYSNDTHLHLGRLTHLLPSLDWIAISMPVSRQSGVLIVPYGADSGRHKRCTNRCTKSFRPCPISPTVADYCRRIRLIPLSPASELPTVTARPHGMKGRERASEETGKYQTSIVCGGVVQLVRTPACHAGGRGFESRRSPPFGK